MNQFEDIKELGVGIQGKSYLAKYKATGKLCCLKAIECKNVDLAHKTFNEMLEITMKLNKGYPSIVTPFCMFVHWDDSITSFFFYQVYDYFANGDFYSLMEKHYHSKEPIEEELIKRWIGEIILILQYLELKGVVHRYIGPSNFFLDDNMKVVLKDMCTNLVMHDINTRTRGSTGCMTFCAPEIAVSMEEPNHDTEFWSVGAVVLGLLVCSKFPYNFFTSCLIEYNFNDNALDELFTSISEIYSSDLINTLKDILKKPKSERMVLSSLNDYLEKILDEANEEKQEIIDGVLVPLQTGQSLRYYMGYLINNYRSRVCFKEVLSYFDENISEAWSFFSFDSNTFCDFLYFLLFHIDSLPLCEIGFKILGVQVYGLLSQASFFNEEPLSVVCQIAQKYPLSQDIQHATAKIFEAAKKIEELPPVLHKLKACKILLEMIKNFPDQGRIVLTIFKALWPMMLSETTAQDVHELKGCSGIVNAISLQENSPQHFEIACLVVYGLSLYDPNVVDLNQADCVAVMLHGLMMHKHEPQIVVNACNALASMVDAEEESAYSMAVTTSGDVTIRGIVYLGDLCRLHMDNKHVIKSICNVFNGLCRHDDIVSEMKCSGVGEVIDDLRNAYMDEYELNSVCVDILDKIKSLKPLVDT